jgi:4a-hydroxytetrahydrobiopterin dehydratase
MENQSQKLSSASENTNLNNDDLKILSSEEISERLKNFPGWTYAGGKITKEFRFTSFVGVVKFIDILAPFCNSIDHHPDIHIYYTRVVFELQRFSVGGKVTPRDFVVAQEIEKIYSEQ